MPRDSAQPERAAKLRERRRMDHTCRASPILLAGRRDLRNWFWYGDHLPQASLRGPAASPLSRRGVAQECRLRLERGTGSFSMAPTAPRVDVGEAALRAAVRPPRMMGPGTRAGDNIASPEDDCRNLPSYGGSCQH